MTDAPERIWAWTWVGDVSRGQWALNQSVNFDEEAEYIRADIAEAEKRAAVKAERRRLAEEWRDRRMTLSVIPMPLTSDDKGPATLGVDAVKIFYEVWDQATFEALSSHEYVADAIAAAIGQGGAE
jgi:exoribonuclease II